MKKIAYVVDSVFPSKEANSVHAAKMAYAFSKCSEITLFCKELIGDSQKAFDQYGVMQSFAICATNNRKGSGRIKILLDGWLTSRNIKKNGKFDALYGRSAVSLFFSRKIAPFVFETHEWPTSKAMYYLQKWMLSSKKCKGLVTITEELKKKYLEEFPFLKQSNVIVLQDAADPVFVIPEPIEIDNRRSSDPSVIIGYLGHLYPGKCMEIIIELAKLRPNYLFHIAGGTQEMVYYWSDELKKNKVKNVVLYGFITNKDIGKWYSAFDVFLLPLKSNILVGNGKKNIGKWISPLKLFEAMAYGKAIISSDLPTIKEVMINEQDGLIVSADKIDEWAEALDRMIVDGELRQRLGAAAKNKLEEQYTWSKRANRIVEML